MFNLYYLHASTLAPIGTYRSFQQLIIDLIQVPAGHPPGLDGPLLLFPLGLGF